MDAAGSAHEDLPHVYLGGLVKRLLLLAAASSSALLGLAPMTASGAPTVFHHPYIPGHAVRSAVGRRATGRAMRRAATPRLPRRSGSFPASARRAGRRTPRPGSASTASPTPA